jgi:hypothetical protein
MDYKVPDLGVDPDILTCNKNIADLEAKYPLKSAAIQLDSSIDREPLLTWEASVPATHPMNYPMPNFGVDTDIKAS